MQVNNKSNFPVSKVLSRQNAAVKASLREGDPQFVNGVEYSGTNPEYTTIFDPEQSWIPAQFIKTKPGVPWVKVPV